MPDITEEILLKKFQLRNIKPTAMRILVLKALMQQDHAVSLHDMELLFDRADRSTLFRTLKTFEDHHLIHRIEDGTGSVKYALCSDNCDCGPESFHIHFHCRKCGNTYCMPTDNAIQKVNFFPHFKTEQVNIILKGICDKCSG